MKKIKLIAVVAALIAGLCIYQLCKELSKPAEIPRTTVVVATVDIPANTVVTSEMVTLTEIATEALMPNVLLDTASVIGKVLSSNIYAGEQIIKERLVPEDQNTDLVYKIEPGMRAITLAVSQVTGVSYMLKPGNRVDLIMNYQIKAEEEETEEASTEAETMGTAEADASTEETEEEMVTKTRYLLQNVTILAVDSVMKATGSSAYVSVTLMVSPEEALEVANIDSQYSLRLVLRNALDNEEEEIIDVSLDTILETETEETP